MNTAEKMPRKSPLWEFKEKEGIAALFFNGERIATAYDKLDRARLARAYAVIEYSETLIPLLKGAYDVLWGEYDALLKEIKNHDHDRPLGSPSLETDPARIFAEVRARAQARAGK